MKIYKHKGRGTTVAIIGVGRAQGKMNDDDPVVLYREANGSLWARHQAEFCDGRFEAFGEESQLQVDATAYLYDLNTSDGFVRDHMSLAFPNGHKNIRPLVLLSEFESAVERAQALELMLLKMVNALKDAPLISGVCHCGGDMEDHADPMSEGHVPVDMGTSFVNKLCEEASNLMLTLDEDAEK